MVSRSSSRLSRPSDFAHASSTGNVSGALISLTVTLKVAVRPASSDFGYSTGKVPWTSRGLPTSAPIRPFSKPAIMVSLPSTSGTFSPLPPSTGAPSMKPSKSITTWSPEAAGRGASIAVYLVRERTRFCSRRSTSPSSGSAVSRVSAIASTSTGGTSGSTSTPMLNSRSLPSSDEVTSTLGCSAGFRLLSSIALRAPSSTACCRISSRSVRPYCLRSSDAGALPGRNPGMRIVFTSSWRRVCTRLSISPAGTTTLNSRRSPSAAICMTCIVILSSLRCLVPRLRATIVGRYLRAGAGGETRTRTAEATGT